MWLLDTVAISELRKPQINSGVLTWLSGINLEDLHTSVLCVGELRRGVTLAPEASRPGLNQWLDVQLQELLPGRVLPVDQAVASHWGALGRRGKTEPVDALIGSTAAVAGLTVVTRNVKHFDGLAVSILNPWT